eukprot:8439868-Lingulodinium_polyedra.AAC.1
MASKKLSPAELQETIPMGFPTPHTIEGIPRIAKYPIDLRAMNGAPMMTAKGWAKLCMMIADKYLDNLQHVFDTAAELGGQESFRAISEEE